MSTESREQLFILPPITALPSSFSCAHGRLRPAQNQNRLLLMAFVPPSSPRNPSSDLGARRGSPQACPQAGAPCVCWRQLPSPSTAPALPPARHRSLAAAQAWQPAPKSPVAMALQQHCREPRLPAHDTHGTGNLGMASRARLGANPPRQGLNTQREPSRHLPAAADKAGAVHENPVSAQDVSYDKTLSLERAHSCNSHYNTCTTHNSVSGGECATGGKIKSHILENELKQT